MRRLDWHQVSIVAVAVAVFFTSLGATHLWDKDETIYGSCAREMFERGDWVVPTFNGDLFPDKPPLMYWLMISGFHWFGVGAFGARFFSAVLGTATALATYHLGRILFRAEVGLWAGLIVTTNIIFTVSARAATVDAALTFATVLSVLFFAIGSKRAGFAANSGSSGATSDRWSGRVPTDWWAFAGMYASMGLAVLAKGPVGLLLPLATIGLFQLVIDRLRTGPQAAARWRGRRVAALRWLASIVAPARLARATWVLRPLTAWLVVAAVTVPWFLLVGLRTDGVWLKKFFIEQNVQRALMAFDNHSGPFFYYVPAILIGFFPWSVFLAPAGIDAVCQIRRSPTQRASYLFCFCWLGVVVVFWSLVRTKLPHYVLPAYPALALLTGATLAGWLEQPESLARGWLLNATVTWMVVGIVLVIVFPVVAAYVLPGEGGLGLIGLVLVAGGLGALALGWRRQLFRMAVLMVATSALFLIGIFGVAARRIDRYQNAPPMLDVLAEAGEGHADLAAYRFFRESFAFYFGRPIPRCQGTDALASFLGHAERPYVLTTDEYLDEIERAFPGRLHVVARRPRFLKRGELVLLAPADRGKLRWARKRARDSFP